MVLKPTEKEREMISLLSHKMTKDSYHVDLDSGEVYARGEVEWTRDSDNIYVGTLRRKLIPDRKRLWKEQKKKHAEELQKKTETEDLEKRLEQGMIVCWNTDSYIPELAQRYNLHMGQPYRMIVSGSNIADSMEFDGIMTGLKAFMDNKGFTIQTLVLRDGLKRAGSEERTPFDREVFNRGTYNLLGFGSIEDKSGFYKARERIK